MISYRFIDIGHRWETLGVLYLSPLTKKCYTSWPGHAVKSLKTQINSAEGPWDKYITPKQYEPISKCILGGSNCID